MTITHSDSSPRVGQTIAGKFVIEAVVAVGGIGTVYRARQLGLDRVVALKLLREEFARDEDFLERFKREARAASRLDHPNSVRVLDFGQHDDGSMLYLAMEYVEGRTLYDVIRQDAPLPDARIVDILSQVLAAVGVAHDMGVVHRDLKPENIMIIRSTSDEGEHAEVVKVLDFGIASLGNAARESGAYAEGPRMTKRGLIVGTPEYMAPEQADGRADRRSDIYSLGVVLYQMLTGRLPFRGDSPLTVAVKHITEALELPSQIAPVNPRIEAVCVRALDKTPDERYGSAREMRSALRAAINLAPSRASAPQAVISGADSQSGPLFGTRRTPLGQASSGQASGEFARRRHASLVVGLALATLFAAALGARSWWVKSHRVPGAPDRAATAVAAAGNAPTPMPTPAEAAQARLGERGSRGSRAGASQQGGSSAGHAGQGAPHGARGGRAARGRKRGAGGRRKRAFAGRRHAGRENLRREGRRSGHRADGDRTADGARAARSRSRQRVDRVDHQHERDPGWEHPRGAEPFAAGSLLSRGAARGGRCRHGNRGAAPQDRHRRLRHRHRARGRAIPTGSQTMRRESNARRTRERRRYGRGDRRRDPHLRVPAMKSRRWPGLLVAIAHRDRQRRGHRLRHRLARRARRRAAARDRAPRLHALCAPMLEVPLAGAPAG